MSDTTGHRLGLGADELLSTTRAVRKRLDLERPVEMQLVDECLELAAQAPTGSNAQGWHFLVVTDPDKRARLGEMYRQGFEMFYGDRAAAEAGLPADLAARLARATVAGAGALLKQSEHDAATLRTNVTSPKGTTAAALKVLMEEEAMERLLTRAVAEAAKRSRELSS